MAGPLPEEQSRRSVAQRFGPNAGECCKFIKVVAICRYVEEMDQRRCSRGDHTVILSSNRRDVVTFGKGGEGQLGLSSKPWVSAPAKAKALSSSHVDISAVCAFRNCSMTLDRSGAILSKAGKCSMEAKGMQKLWSDVEKRAKETGLINAST